MDGLALESLNIIFLNFKARKACVLCWIAVLFSILLFIQFQKQQFYERYAFSIRIARNIWNNIELCFYRSTIF